MIVVRNARLADATAMSVVLIASITELCVADHRNDPAQIAQWTRNKSPDGVRAMLAKPRMALSVAEVEGAIAGVAGYEGEIVALNYVSPTHRLKGVSKALLVRMESEMKAQGHKTIRLFSSATAHRFYLGCGWIDVGKPGEDYALSGRPMVRHL